MLLGLRTTLMNYTSDEDRSLRLHAYRFKKQLLQDNVLHSSPYLLQHHFPNRSPTIKYHHLIITMIV